MQLADLVLRRIRNDVVTEPERAVMRCRGNGTRLQRAQTHCKHEQTSTAKVASRESGQRRSDNLSTATVQPTVSLRTLLQRRPAAQLTGNGSKYAPRHLKAVLAVGEGELARLHSQIGKHARTTDVVEAGASTQW
jgi:hypothetical protein